jgi:tetratricopeptide (TPR) repeat protein
VALSPGLEAAAINLGFAYLKADRPDDAEKIFQPFLKDSNKQRAAKAHYGLGLVMAARGETAKAKAVFEAAAALNPDDVRPHYRLGQIALQAGDWENAVLLFSLVLSKDDLHHGAAYGLSRAYAGLGRKDDADRAAEAHRKILDVSDALPGLIRKLADAKDPVAARLAIGQRLSEAGAPKSGHAWYKRASLMDPSNADLKRRLREIESRPESRR